MLTIKLKDDTTLECIDVFGQKKHVQGAHRDVFEFHFSVAENTFESLNDLFSDASKTEEITIIETKTVEGEEGQEEIQQEFLHKNFSLHVSSEVRQVEMAKETTESPAVYESRFVVTLGQLTYSETKLAQLEQESLMNMVALAELHGLILAGGTLDD